MSRYCVKPQARKGGIAGGHGRDGRGKVVDVVVIVCSTCQWWQRHTFHHDSAIDKELSTTTIYCTFTAESSWQTP
jgi:hypothetical protein